MSLLADLVQEIGFNRPLLIMLSRERWDELRADAERMLSMYPAEPPGPDDHGYLEGVPLVRTDLRGVWFIQRSGHHYDEPVFQLFRGM